MTDLAPLPRVTAAAEPAIDDATTNVRIGLNAADHSRVIEMKPYINLMKDTIIMNCKEKKQ